MITTPACVLYVVGENATHIFGGNFKHSRKLDAVTIEMVKDTPEGISGWADVMVTAAVAAKARAAPKTKAKAKTKATAKPKPGDKPYDLTDARNPERDCKGIMAALQTSDNSMSKLRDTIASDPETFAWTANFIKHYQDFVNDMDSKLMALNIKDFMLEFRASALSPQALRELKKRYRDSYNSKLVKFCVNVGPVVQELTNISTRLTGMMLSAQGSLETPQKKRNTNSGPSSSQTESKAADAGA